MDSNIPNSYYRVIRIAIMKQLSQNKIPQSKSLDDIQLEEQIFDISSELFNPHRFMILNVLLRHGVLDFSELKHGIHAKSDGHLASHLRALVKSKLIDFKKEFVDNRPKTFYMLTDKGREEFLKLTQILKISLKGIDNE